MPTKDEWPAFMVTPDFWHRLQQALKAGEGIELTPRDVQELYEALE